MIAVLTNIHSLGRIAQRVPGFTGPALGAKLAEKTPRLFSEEQMREAAAAPTLLVGKGSHGGATQAGTFDTSKNIAKVADVRGLEGLGSGSSTLINQGSAGLASQAGTVDTSKNIVRNMG